MLSLFILLGLIPAGLMIVGDGGDEDPEDGSGPPQTGAAPAPPIPLDQALAPPDPTAGPTGTEPGPAQPDLTGLTDPGAPAAPPPGIVVPAPVLPYPDLPPAAGDPLGADLPPENLPASEPPDSAPPETPDPVPDVDADAGPDSPSAAPQDEDPAEGEDLLLGPEDGDQTVTDFRPGEDLLTIAIEDDQVIAFRSLHPDSGAPQLRLFGHGAEQVITFAGLPQLPEGDIFLSLTDPVSGAVVSLPLADFLFRDEDALDPLRPEEPSWLTPQDPDLPPDPGLDPVPAGPDYDVPPVLTPAGAHPAPPPDPAARQLPSAQTPIARAPLPAAQAG